jgi:hypothetical protein
VVLSAVTMVAIVITGRYPQAMFKFNVGVRAGEEPAVGGGQAS